MCPLMSGSCGAGGSMIFDTDVLIWFLRGDGAAARLIESQSDRAISMISAMELLQGARSRAEIKTIHQFIQQSVFAWRVGGSRAERWEQNVERRWGLDAATKAVMTLLLLRGAQTPGELRARSERLHAFATLDEVESALAKLAEGLEPLVVELSRAPGQKEGRWTHLVGGPVEEAATPSASAPAPSGRSDPLASRVPALEEGMADLSRERSELNKKVGEDYL